MSNSPRQLPPIVKDARELRRLVELAVGKFSRAHKYDLGADLRRDARAVMRAAIDAWRDRDGRLARVEDLSRAADDFKLTLQLAHDVRAFCSFGNFEEVASKARSLGRQVGGWLKQLHQKDQNQPADAQAGRVQILSSRTASLAEASS
jgi:hypothetical protein